MEIFISTVKPVPSPASLCCGPWARHIYPSLVLVKPRKTSPYLTERLLINQTVNPVYNGHSKIDKTKILMTNDSLMKVLQNAPLGAFILQYFRPQLSDNWSWKSIFSLFESGPFTQVLLYTYPYHAEYMCIIGIFVHYSPLLPSFHPTFWPN